MKTYGRFPWEATFWIVFALLSIFAIVIVVRDARIDRRDCKARCFPNSYRVDGDGCWCDLIWRVPEDRL